MSFGVFVVVNNIPPGQGFGELLALLEAAAKAGRFVRLERHPQICICLVFDSAEDLQKALGKIKRLEKRYKSYEFDIEQTC